MEGNRQSVPTDKLGTPLDGDSAVAPGVPLSQAVRVWVRIAMLSFGGPAGQIAVMHRILVDEKRWVSEQRFLHALNFCMLLPGPEAQQLATYIGWLMHRTPGGLIAGGLFIVPGIIVIMALSYLYAGYGNIPLVTALFFGLKAAVLAIVLEAMLRIGRRALKTKVTIGIAAVAFVAIFFFAIPFPIIIVGAAAIGVTTRSMDKTAPSSSAPAPRTDAENERGMIDRALGHQVPDHVRPSVRRAIRQSAVCLVLWLFPVAALIVALGAQNIFSQVAVFFSKIAIVTFGGAYAVLAYVAQQAVETYGWLKPSEMLDGLGMAETTPGPLIMVLQFVGFMAAYRHPGALAPMWAGTLGALLATWVTFVPCFLWIFLGAPFVEALRGNKAIGAALSAITAAVVGVVLNLAIWFAFHSIFRAAVSIRAFPLSFDAPAIASVDPWALLISVAAGIAVFRFKIGMIPMLAACCASGVVLYMLGATA